MEKPLCKICKERHYGLCSEFTSEVGGSLPKPAPPQQRAKADRPSVRSEGWDNLGGSAETLPTAVPRDKEARIQRFDRVAYQREYMRKRRAKNV